MLATIALFLWAIGLYVILRYRVHFHVTYTKKGEPARNGRGHRVSDGAGYQMFGRRASSFGRDRLDAISGPTPLRAGKKNSNSVVPERLPIAAESGLAKMVADLESALIGMGCAKLKARQIALRVAESGEDFDTMLRAAIREAA